ncbi:cation transporter [Arsenicicoccus piscis]|uniref:Metal-binding protein n=1 Tax=Arsenicicoccus piscis TaxID=673954 RepID=A0ABQ6HSS5_9MICO|nr:cation transporter [Arsenicicoccus piscis]MCH8626570.1 cation transporter [Arsenicicoccus piscis]GMA21217.1 metal-binding protein [Arsenicicoccus piscis]
MAAETTVLVVKGMTCGHCAQAVTTELSAVEGVTSVEVADVVPNHDTAVTVHHEGPITSETLAEAVDEAGYQVVL